MHSSFSFRRRSSIERSLCERTAKPSAVFRVIPRGSLRNARHRIDLPYFDILLEEIQRGKRDISVAFGRHVHWGYWGDDHAPDGSMEDFDVAAERMAQRVYAAARVQDDEP